VHWPSKWSAAHATPALWQEGTQCSDATNGAFSFRGMANRVWMPSSDYRALRRPIVLPAVNVSTVTLCSLKRGEQEHVLWSPGHDMHIMRVFYSAEKNQRRILPCLEMLVAHGGICDA